MSTQPGKVVLSKVPSQESKLHAHNSNPRRRQDLPSMLVHTEATTDDQPEDTENQAIVKMITDHPELYDDDARPRRSIAKSAAILAKGAEILETFARVKLAKGQAKTMPEAVSLVVAEQPELYDALVRMER